MIGALLTVVFVALSVASGQLSYDDFDNIPRDAALSQRRERFFPLFSVVRFPNSQCSANNILEAYNGTCLTKRECATQGGTSSGSCANGFGVCCVFQKSCGSKTNANNTYFINPSYPMAYDGGDRCTITVQRCNPDICQLRLDFIDFTLGQPSSEGSCDYDFMTVSGGASRVPRICGENTEHVYVDFDGSNPIKISMDASTELPIATKRHWNIRIQQIACDSPWRAPPGCLQYYTTVSGTVMSFNYGTTTNPRTATGSKTIGSREIANLNYGICVKSIAGYCSIRWSPTDSASFSVTGDVTMDPTPTVSSGSNCTTDFIIIPNPTEVNTATSGSITEPTDRFCGSSLTPKITSTKPFVMYVVTDDKETTGDMPDTENKGFSLMYKQVICPT